MDSCSTYNKYSCTMVILIDLHGALYCNISDMILIALDQTMSHVPW